jgi:hypothetical protein
MICLLGTLPPDRRIWGQLAVGFALVYVPLVSMSYMVEMLVVEPRVMRGESASVALLTLTTTMVNSPLLSSA